MTFSSVKLGRTHGCIISLCNRSVQFRPKRIRVSFRTSHQFKHITDSQSEPIKSFSENLAASRSRSRSLDTRKDYRVDELTERMKHTFGFKLKGFKANTRGNYIQEPFITLDDLLSKTPDSMTLNIEISKSTHSSYLHRMRFFP